MFKPSEKQVRNMVYDCRVTDNDDNSRVNIYLRRLDLSGLDWKKNKSSILAL